jgi:hypothetical protein
MMFDLIWMLLETYLKELIHLLVGLKHIPPGGANPLSHRALLDCSRTMMVNLPEFTEDLPHDSAKHEEGLSRLDAPPPSGLVLVLGPKVIMGSDHELHERARALDQQTTELRAD